MSMENFVLDSLVRRQMSIGTDVIDSLLRTPIEARTVVSGDRFEKSRLVDGFALFNARISMRMEKSEKENLTVDLLLKLRNSLI